MEQDEIEDYSVQCEVNVQYQHYPINWEISRECRWFVSESNDE